MLTTRTLALLALVAGTCIAATEVAPISVPRYTQPGAGQIFYMVMTDRFDNGSTANDTGGIPGGPEVNGFDPTRTGYFHGGDFVGLTSKLDYIKGLGVTAVWVTPPFRNKAVQGSSAGYHGYWIEDFLNVDPHLGTDAEFAEFVKQAHARGLEVYLDIVVNHTADVIQYRGGKTEYVTKTEVPYRDANGQPFDPSPIAYNGLNSADSFPALSVDRSFPYVPYVPTAEAHAKNPEWLNNPIYYHNRGDSSFRGESAQDGDFVGLDDVFTEQPAVVRGFIDIYGSWIQQYGIDGYRIDTAMHVNREFWQAFTPAITEIARKAGKPGFVQFGEVDTDEVALLSEFPTGSRLDATLDFGFLEAARHFVSNGESSTMLADFFDHDDLYTDRDRNAQTQPTFLDNHDRGRFANFLETDNPSASREELLALDELGHGLLLLSRGQPVVYYGDEQGMLGRGGRDQPAREDMFPSRTPSYRNAPLLGTTRTGADDKFDPQHPMYRLIHALADLRNGHPALSRGAMIVRPTHQPNLFAFSRIERGELVEYVAAFNNSRLNTVSASVPTSQPAGALLHRVFDSAGANTHSAETLTADDAGHVTIALAPLQFAVWRAAAPVPSPAHAPEIAITSPAKDAILTFTTHEAHGQIILDRQPIRAVVTGSDGVGEVTFTMVRASRPTEYELLGTDDTPPYRLFWRPPPDLAPGETVSFIATFDDLRGHRVATRVDGVKVDAGTEALVQAPTAEFGPHGGVVPVLNDVPTASLDVKVGAALKLSVSATGSTPLHYQWYHNGAEITGANDATLDIAHTTVTDAGRYSVVVSNVAGAAVTPESAATVSP